ncbi:hypothetical protein Ddc_15364 [Ditylenchus destructor]|nr:hypothetical protein Ddc_15364 [Ditylenchus destructor]
MPLPATTFATTGSTFATFEVPSSPTTPVVVKQHMPPITIALPHRPASGPIPGGPNAGVLSRLGQAQLAVAAAAAVASRQQNNGTSGRSDQSEDEVREPQVEIRQPEVLPAQVTTTVGTHGTIASTSTLKNAIVRKAFETRSRALSANRAPAKSLLSSNHHLAVSANGAIGGHSSG